MSLYEIELEWIRALQNVFRSSLMDRVFIGWNYVDTYPFLILLVAIIWFAINKRIGIRLLFVIILSSILNMTFKSFFNLPRPCQIDPSVGLFHFSSPGFPSGAAQTATIIAGVTLLECKKRWQIYLGLLFAFFLCFSRIYLGVHYFTDILGGIIVGSFLSFIYWGLSKLIERRGVKIFLFFPVLILLTFQSRFLEHAGLALGVSAGLLLDEKRNFPIKNWQIASLEILTAILGASLLIYAKILYPNLKFLLAIIGGFWFSFLGAFFIRKTKNFLTARNT